MVRKKEKEKKKVAKYIEFKIKDLYLLTMHCSTTK